MDAIAVGSPEDRSALFLKTTETMEPNVRPSVIEKDFWVCWTLSHLFKLKGIPDLVFKGGTSLSKAYGAIERFSEDIDITVSRDDLGFGDDKDPLKQETRSARKRQRKQLKSACQEFVALRCNFP